ncbi:putative nonribosomal peptide synthase, partial [Aspergillus steynii IBT 23096]
MGSINMSEMVPTGVQSLHLASRMQEEMILSTAADPLHRSYIETYHFHTHQRVDAVRLNDAVHRIADNHAILRSIFTSSGTSESAKVQIAVLKPEYVRQRAQLLAIVPSTNSKHLPVIEFEFADLAALDGTEWKGSMPWKLSLAELPDRGEWRITLSYHHSLMDGSSARSVMAWIRQETSFPGSVTETSDFFEMDRELAPLRCQSIRAALEGSLRNVNPPAPLGQNKQSPSIQTHEIVRTVSTQFSARLDQAAVPAWVARLALSITLCTFQNANEAVFLEMTSGRKNLSSNVRHTVGPTLIPQIRTVSLGEDDSLGSKAQSLRSSRDISHAFSVGELKSLAPTLSREIQVCLVCQTNESYPSNGIGDWEWRGVDTENDLPFLVELMPGQGTSFHVKIRYHQPTFELGYAQEFLRYFCRALQWLEEVNREIGNWTLTAAITKLTSLGNYAKHYTELSKKPYVQNDSCAHHLIDETAAKWPKKIALQFENDGFVTYAELARRSTELADILRAQLPSEISQPLVPICFDKSLEMVVTILAVLKAGAAYVPLDPSHPEERLEAILRSCKASLVLWGSLQCPTTLSAACSSLGVQLKTIDQLICLDAGALKADRQPQQSASSLAYVLFTSGSTGTPKGVMVEHRNLVAFMVAGEGNADGSWTSTRLQLAAYSFDVSIGDLFANLWQGGRLALVPRDKMLSDLNYWLEETCSSHIALTPTVGDLILPSMPARLKTFMFGGETFHRSFLAQAPTEAKVWNTCGPTETVVDVACCVLDPANPTTTPIGRPFGACSLYIVRPGTNAVLPPQAVGEICVAGPQVSRGYLGREDLTARVFIPDPFSHSRKGRMYRTGDFGKLDADGAVEHLGRIDSQVKLRGLRVETGEVEAVIKQSSAALAHVCVDVHQSVSGEDTLVAWLVASGGQDDEDARQVWKRDVLVGCQRRLPGYMIPAVWILVSELPLTTSAKLHRRTLHAWFQQTEKGVSLDGIVPLSAPEQQTRTPVKIVATERERTLAAKCAAILSIDSAEISMNSNFISLGGSSLQAMRLITSLRQEGIDCSLARVLGPTTLGELAAEPSSEKNEPQDLVEARNWSSNIQGWETAVGSVGIAPGAVEALYPCTPLQEGLISTSLQTNSSAYVANMTIGLGDVLDQQRFEKAWQAIVSRHSILRTAFLSSSGVEDYRASEHNFFQVVLRASSEQVIRLSDLKTNVLSFQLGTIPLSGRVVRAAEGDWTLQLDMHHVLYDEAYLSRLVTELSLEYEQQTLGSTLDQLSPSSSFANFASALHARDSDNTRQFWKSYLDGMVPATWPIAGGLHTTDAGKGAVERRSQEWKGDVRRLARSLQVTPAAVIRAALAITIAEHSDVEDVVIGEVSSGRMDHESFVLGPCAATHPVRIHVDRSSPSLQDVASRALESYLKVLPHQHYGLASIRKETSNPDMMPFQTLFVHQEAYDKSFQSDKTFKLESIELGNLGFPLVVESRSSHETGIITIECSFNHTKISSTNVEWVLRHLSRALDLLLIAKETESSNDLPMGILDKNEEKILVEWSIKPDDPLIMSQAAAEKLCIHELADKQAHETPEKVAVQVDQEEFITFRQLKEQSDKVAHALTGRLEDTYSDLSVDRQPIVPICFDKSAAMIIAMLAVLKSGSAWVPIDPRHPRDRIESIIHQTDARLIVCGPTAVRVNLQEAADSRGAVAIDLNDLIRSRGIARAPFRRPTPSSLAYILFTSGSTGTPKGVMLEHRNAVAFVLAQEQDLMGTWTSVRFQLAVYTFDAAVWEIFMPLSIGGRVALATAPDFLLTLPEWFERTSTTHIFITPRAADLLADRVPPYLRTLAIGGEAFNLSILPRLPQECRILNVFGPTETTILVATFLVPREDMERQNMPIGRPLGASQIYILRPGTTNRVVIGAVGEICVGGPQVARGYLGRPTTTKEVFVENPYRPGERLYRTGDLGRFSDRGVVEHLGRIDGQIKLRGLRIETAEIESVCLRHPQVNACVVIVLSRAEGDVLVGFAQIGDSQGAVNSPKWAAIEKELNNLLGDNVPGYMIPSRIIGSDQIPITSHGKVDRRALQAQAKALDQQGHLLRADLGANTTLVKGSLEDRVAEVWSRALGIEKALISPDVGFARLGGDSIRAIRLLSMLRAAGFDLNIVDVSNQSTVSTQAQKASVNQRRPSSQPAVIPDDPAEMGWVELGPIASMYGDLQQRAGNSHDNDINHFNQSMLLDVTGVPIKSLQSALHGIQRHHDMLRVVVDWGFDSPVSSWRMKVLPWSQATPVILLPTRLVTRDILRLQLSARVRGLDIRQGKVMDAALYQEHGSERTLLFWTIHHFVVDIVSWQLLLQDLNTILRATDKQASLQPTLTSFPKWTLAGKADSLDDANPAQSGHRRILSKRDQVMMEDSPLWLRNPSCAKADSYIQIKSSARIDGMLTQFLLGSANDIFGTEPLDLLLTAMGMTVGRLLKDEIGQLEVGLETHGRHVRHDTMDVSRTVGWFTAILPLLLDCTSNSSSIEKLVRHTKDRRAQIMHQNMGFRQFVDGRWKNQNPTEGPFSLVLNYQGIREEQACTSDETVRPATVPGVEWQETSENAVPLSFAWIEVYVQGKETHVECSWPGEPGFEIDDVAAVFAGQVEKVCQALNSHPQGLSPLIACSSSSAFGLISEDFVDRIYELFEKDGIPTHTELEDIVPCTPMQRALIFEGLANSAACSYITSRVWKLASGEASITRARKAVTSLVRRHEVLRTRSFVDTLEGPINLVFKPNERTMSRTIETVEVRDSTQVAAEVDRITNDSQAGHPLIKPFCARIVYSADLQNVQLSWRLHHSLVDAWSQDIIFNELVLLLVEAEPEASMTPRPSYGSFARFISTADFSEDSKFWAQSFANYDPAPIPASILAPNPETADAIVIEQVCGFQSLLNWGVSPGALLSLAWSVVLSEVLDSDDVTHGMLFSGRNVPVLGVEDIVGPCITTVPIRTHIQRHQSVTTALRQTERFLQDASKHSKIGVAGAAKASGTEASSLVTTLLNFFGTRTDALEDSRLRSVLEARLVEDGVPPSVTLSCWRRESDENVIVMRLEQRHLLEPCLAQRLMNRLAAYCHNFSSVPDATLQQAIASATDEQSFLNTWSLSSAPAPSKKTYACLHDLVANQAREFPQKVALQFEESEFVTYEDLDQRTTSLARSIRQTHGLPSPSQQPVIPICFDRSMDMVIAILAVLKAGAAFVPINASDPAGRLKSIIRTSNAPFIIGSHVQGQETLQDVARETATNIYTIKQLLTMPSTVELPAQDSGSLAYVLFTSGSTGEPKGVMIEHRNVTSFIASNHEEIIGRWSACRMPVAAYTFDVSMGDLLTGLAVGARVALVQSQKLLASMAEWGNKVLATTLSMTPSLASLLRTAVPAYLQTLLLAGETFDPAIMQVMKDECRVWNGYGPTETFYATFYRVEESENRGFIPIGRPFHGNRIYLLYPETLERVPIGAVGEICVCGTQVARGYLARPELTAERFTSDPFDSHGIMYRTGDLGRFHADGSIEFLGRLDGQVKIRGQRAETAEIESVISSSSERITRTAVDIMRPQKNSLKVHLTACIVLSPKLEELEAAELVKSVVKPVCHHRLQSYMVPLTWICLDELPLTASGKTDKRKLASWIENIQNGEEVQGGWIISSKPLKPVHEGRNNIQPPANELEMMIQEACASLLGQDVAKVSMGSSFAALGGDSLLALQLNARLREEGLDSAPRAILQAQSLASLASICQPASDTESRRLNETMDLDSVGTWGDSQTTQWQAAAQDAGYSVEQIQHAMPCTPLQEGVLSSGLTGGSIDGYLAVFKVRLGKQINMDGIRKAWSSLVCEEEMLRTAFILNQETVSNEASQLSPFLQIVLHPSCPEVKRVMTLSVAPTSKAQLERPEAHPSLDVDLHLGNIPLSALLTVTKDEPEEEFTLEVALHHASYDEAYLSALLGRLSSLYRDAAKIPTDGLTDSRSTMDNRVSFSTFVRFLYSNNSAATAQFWKGHLKGAQPASWPVKNGLQRSMDTMQEPMFKSVQWKGGLRSIATRLHVTPAAVARAAIALTVAEHADNSDVVLGEVSNGQPDIQSRGRMIEGVISGPCATTHPVRLRLNDDTEGSRCSVRELVQQSFNTYLACLPHQYCGLTGIRQQCDRPELLPFQVLFAYQEAFRKSNLLAQDAPFEIRNGKLGHMGFPLMVACTRQEDDSATSFHCSYAPEVLDSTSVEWFLHHITQALNLIAQVAHTESATAEPARPMPAQITPSTQEISQLDRWSRADPNTREAGDSAEWTVDQMFEHNARTMPNKIALQFEDSEWITYGDLDYRSSQASMALRNRLATTGNDIGSVMVPICYERSVDMMIAVLAVLKSGAAYAPLDPSQPGDRLAMIVRKTKARVILCGTAQKNANLLEASGAVGADLTTLEELYDERFIATAPEPRHDPSSTAVVLFTSGSTGQPKGVMIAHRNLMSFVEHIQENAAGTWRICRVPIASYTFDGSMAEMLVPLCIGGRVGLVPEQKLLPSLPHWLEMLKATHLVMSTTIARLFCGAFRDPTAMSHLRCLFLGGESFDMSLLKHVPDECHVYNAYGPTETVVYVTLQRVHRDATLSDSGVPIGGPVGKNAVYLLRPESDSRVPLGVVGEICVAGDQVTQGYLDQPDVTQRHFHPNLVNPSHGRKIYRTGDLGRYNSSGRIEYRGRKDAQVKVRGQRVELSEIETILHEHELVKDSAVVVTDTPTGAVLVSFCLVDTCQLPGEEWEAIASRIKAHATSRLPSHMVPSYVINLEGDVPRVSTGKIDRKALEERARAVMAEDGSKHEREYVAPVTETETILCEVFGEILSRRVGITDRFIDIGIHSVLAIRAVSKINQRLQSRISLIDVFDFPTPCALAKRVDDTTAQEQYSIIPRAPRDQDAEQSFAQNRLWFLDQLHPGSASYLMPLGLRIHGKLQLEAFERAVQAIERRHETLRTTFESRDGCHVQVVHPFRPQSLRMIHTSPEDGEEASLAALKEEQTKPFDIQVEPGWRVAVIRSGPTEHILSIVIHHIISDGWSIGILLKELDILYSAAARGESLDHCLEPLPIQYRDFSVWQKQDEQAVELQRQLDYWVEKLTGSQPAQLLLDKPRPQALSGNALFKEVIVEGDLYHALSDFCKQYQTTAFIVLLATFRAAHYRLTGASDATIGTPIANRGRTELEGLIGLFVNVQCIRTQLDDADTFEALVKQVQSTVHEAFAHQDVPFEHIVSTLQPTRDASRNPLVQTAFAVHPKTPGQGKLDDLETQNILLARTSRMDLEVHLFHEDNVIQGQVTFARDLFVPETIRALISTFYAILACGLKDPSSLLGSIPLMKGTAALRELGLLDIKRTNYPRDCSVVDVFREQAAINPGRTAVCDNTGRVTYRQLDNESDKVAGWLLGQSFAPETLIAVLAPRSVETIVAILGILKANLAYLPLDSRTSEGRLRSIFSCVEHRLMVLVGSHIKKPVVPELEHVQFKQISDLLATQDSGLCGARDSLRVSPSATSLAYIMYTSGSTGKPKGVMIEHRGIVRLVKNCNKVSPEHLGKPVAHMANISFDVSTWEIYYPLLNGGTVVCVDAMTSLDSAALDRRFLHEEVRVAMFTPALFKTHLQQSPATIQRLDALILGGDRLDVQDVAAARKLVRGEIVNGYGPTENTGASASYRIPPQEHCLNGVPIGEAISNSGIYVMDQCLQLVPPGVIGELVVTGDGLARGYTDERRDEDCFLTIDLDGESARAYRTGDYGRWRPADGQLEYFGRRDNQVKIRGHRVELGEIEQTIMAHGSVKDAVTVVQELEGEQSQLAVFVTHSGGTDDTVEDEQVEAWRDIFDGETYDGIANMTPDRLGRDFTGWLSMYDGSAIDTLAMEEWLDDTVQTLLNGGRTRRILEVGTGSGMVLFNIASGLEQYVGVEPVERLAAAIQERANHHDELSGKVKVHAGTADQILTLCPDFSPSLVVVNSVAQYFPSADYLFQLVQDLLQLQGVETLFFGDMRSYPLYNQFLISKALHRAGARASLMQIQQIMAETKEAETELLVDPAFFTSLVSRMPDKVDHVEILPKRMTATNELSCYRYAAVVHVKSARAECRRVHRVKNEEWLDFTAQNLSPLAITRRLKASPLSPVAIANIPHRKTILERHLADALAGDSLMDESQDNWQLRHRNQAAANPGLTATDLERIGQRTGFQVEISWARQHSQGGGLDAIFHRLQPSHGEERVLFDFPTDHRDRLLVSFSNHPVRTQLHRKLQSHLRHSLESRMPSYMVPNTITVLDQMPLTDRSKVDRALLSRLVQRPQKRSVEATSSDSPRPDAVDNTIERVVCEVFGDILGVKVTPADSLFALGGHSLLVPRAASLLSKRLDRSVTVRDVFDCPTPNALAGRFRPTDSDQLSGTDETTSLTGPALSPITKPLEWQRSVEAWGLRAEEVVEANPCTPFQAGVLSNGMAAEHSTNSSYLNIMRLGLSGEQIDPDILQLAWHATLRQEDMLRTAFVPYAAGPGTSVGTASDAFLQAVLQLESGEVRRILKISLPTGQSPSPVNVDFGKIPVSLGLVWTGDGSGMQAELAIHHALYDEAYISWVLTQLSRNYHRARMTGRSDPAPTGRSLDPPRVPFSAFVSHLQSQDYAGTSSFWKDYLHGAPVASLPIPGGLEMSRSASRGVRDCRSADWTGDLRALAGQQGVTAAAIARAAVALVVAEHSGEDEAVLGEVSSGRSLMDASGFVAGPCIATHPVRIQLQSRRSSGIGKRASLEELAKHALDSYLETLPNQHLGLSSIRRQTRTPDLLPFQVLFVYQQPLGLATTQEQDGNYFTVEDGKPGQSEFPLAIEACCMPNGGHLRLRCTFDPVVMPAKDVVQLLDHVTRVLGAMNHQATSPARLAVNPDEMALLHQLAICPDPPQPQHEDDVCAHDLIHRQALQTPNKVAIQFEMTRFMTYGELDQQSSALANSIRYFLGPQLGSEQPLIPIFFEKSFDMVVAIMGVLKAGAAYVPLNASHPEARLLSVCQSTNAKLMLWDGLSGTKTLRTVARTVQASLYTMNDLPRAPSEARLPPMKQSSSSIAYVIYTSGSTGTPKGVMVTHGNLYVVMTSRRGVGFVAWTDNRLQLSAYTFDAAACDLFGPLAIGGRISMVRQEKTWAGLVEWADLLAVNALLTTPSVADLLTPGLERGQLAWLRTLMLCGEPVDRMILQKCPRELTVWNRYGPTETTMDVISCILHGPRTIEDVCHRPFVPIGRPARDNRVYLLRPQTADLVPIGVPGEICIAGPQVSEGYRGQDDLTVARFPADPFVEGAKMYRTGDWGRMHADGMIEFLGRIDHQVKLHGLRMELGEIEFAARTCPGVKACVVVKVECQGSQALVACVEAVVVGKREMVTQETVRNHIAERVPDYMVPAHIHIQTTPFPRTASDKLDRRQIGDQATQIATHRAPTVPSSRCRPQPGSLEERIASCWSRNLALGKDEVDITASFARLGGDSIRAISLLALLRREGLQLNMADFRPSATIKAQAARMRQESRHGDAPRYMQVVARPDSQATMVWIHPGFGQSSVFEGMVPALDPRFNVVLVSDPFFGTPECPQTLRDWAAHYLQDLEPQLTRGQPLVLAGYSFGGLLAIEMATLWQERYGAPPSSIIIADTRPYRPDTLFFRNSQERQESEEAALNRFGSGETHMIQEHFGKQERVWTQSRCPPVYGGRSLFLASTESHEEGVVTWWQSQCPRIDVRDLDCSHGAIFEPEMTSRVSAVINEHCDL